MLKSSVQTEAEKISDRVYAAMETGNAGQARMVLQEFAAVDAQAASEISRSVQAEYGVVL